MKNLKIVADFNKNIISIKYDDIDKQIPITEFAKITLKHFTENVSIIQLIKDYKNG